MSIVFSLGIGLLLYPVPLLSQVSSGGLGPALSTSAASYYFVSKPGELTMQVNIWGYVRNPGRYEIPTSTDIVQLVSFAGGPIQDAKLDEVKVTRFLRRETGISRGEFFVNLEDLSRVDTAKLILYPGDTIFIDHTGWVSLRDLIGVVTVVAVITSAVAQVVLVTQHRY
jgi:protein involved in polysaccharide export with SLBB domain